MVIQENILFRRMPEFEGSTVDRIPQGLRAVPYLGPHSTKPCEVPVHLGSLPIPVSRKEKPTLTTSHFLPLFPVLRAISAVSTSPLA